MQGLGAMDEFDYWIDGSAGQSVPAESSLHVETLADIVPLDGQFGVGSPKTVPDALFEPLFGQPEPTAAEFAEAGGDVDKMLQLHTYALLDAAKVMNLPELLEASGLEHQCLFKGDTFDELKDVAPWIVRLEDSNNFTRNLFTRSNTHWHLWDKEPGTYLRSKADLTTLGAHFRRFTRLQAEDGSWRYFRFWEPLTFQAFLTAAQGRSFELCPMIFGQEGAIVQSIICCPVPGEVTVHTVAQDEILQNDITGPKFTPTHERAIARAMQRRRQLEIGLALRKSFADETIGLSDDELSTLVGRVVQKMSHYQVLSIRHIHTCSAWQLIYGNDFEKRDPERHAEKILASSLKEDQKMVQLRHRLDDLHKAGML